MLSMPHFNFNVNNSGISLFIPGPSSLAKVSQDLDNQQRPKSPAVIDNYKQIHVKQVSTFFKKASQFLNCLH